MSPELEERIYQEVLRSVLWDEGREKIIHMLGVNGVTGAAAEAMYERARGERVAEIRGVGIRKLVRGAFSFFGGVGLFVFFWEALGLMVRPVLIISGILAIFGGWWLLDGFFTTMLAGKKKGPIDEED